MSDQRAAQISFGNGGWVRYRASDLAGPIWFRYAENDVGGLVVIEVFSTFDDAPATSRRLREVARALSAVEAAVAGDPSPIRNRLMLAGPDLRAEVERFAGEVRQDETGGATATVTVAGKGTGQLEHLLHVDRPSARPYPDAFFEQVAEGYHAAMRLGRAPAQRLADANDVSVKTVHGWVAEARKRGALPPARQGRAG